MNIKEELIKNLTTEEKIDLIGHCMESKGQVIKRMKNSLEIVQKYNHLNNDLDAYLYEVINYGLGEREDLPKSEDYGL